MKTDHPRRLTALCVLLCLLCAAASILLGSRFLTPADVLGILGGGGEDAQTAILLYARLPRTAAALLAGAALSVSGCVLQRVLSNRLASPGIVGVNAGAGFGVTLCCSLGLLSGWAVPAFAFGGALLAVTAITLFAARTGASRSGLILGGVALNSILGAFSESLAVLDPDVAMLSTEFRVGGFSAVSHVRLLPAAVMIIAALALLLSLTTQLDVTALGDETAAGLGLAVHRWRILFLVLAALLAGAAVSFTGLLGFVGLIVPHFVRGLVGTRSRVLLPLTALVGAGFVCLCDTLSRLLFYPFELPVGILMAVIGGPVFVVLLVRMRGGRDDA